MAFLIPEKIESQRLILRTFKEDDWKELHAYYSDPECIRYTIGETLSEGQTWRKMAGLIGHWHLRGYGPYAVEEKETGLLIGHVGLWFPVDWPEPEIMWGLIRTFWGKGFAKEAALTVKEMANTILPELHLISLIHPENQRSVNLALALGAVFEKTHSYMKTDCLIYRHAIKK